VTTLDSFLSATSADVGQACTLLPDPEPRSRRYTIVSVDDHLVEPPDLFEGRLPAKLQRRAPRVEHRDGHDVWVYDGEVHRNVGFNACAGRPPEEWLREPTTFDDMRAGCWDVDQRVLDMNIDGVAVSLNFPSFLPGFAGTRFSRTSDPELGLATTRAWNQWHLEAWCGAHPDRFIPCQIPWLCDPVVAAAEIRRNAVLGHKAVSFSENPEGQGLPSLHTDHWDPFLRACEETGTVVCLHIGSSTRMPVVSADGPPILTPTTLLVNSVLAAAEWIWAGIPIRFPGLKLVLSEGGIAWVPALYDRLRYVHDRHAAWGLPEELAERWRGAGITPAESLVEHFWFCTFDDPSGMRHLDLIGVDHVMLESDYPHSDGSWPDTQAMAHGLLGGLSEADADAITHRNACRVFRHPIPQGARP
jgi:predicted TIM-barrel fold metal-dependent hydrolase